MFRRKGLAPLQVRRIENTSTTQRREELVQAQAHIRLAVWKAGGREWGMG